MNYPKLNTKMINKKKGIMYERNFSIDTNTINVFDLLKKCKTEKHNFSCTMFDLKTVHRT